MNIIDFYKTNYKLTFVRVLRQHWKERKKWSCIGEPKVDHLFIYLDGCSVTYTLKNGKKTVAHSGETLYVPMGLEYTAEFSDFRGNNSSAVNVNFVLYNQDGCEVKDFDEIVRFSSPDVALCVKELEDLALSMTPIPTKSDIEVYKIFNIMGDEKAKQISENGGFKIIEKGVEYLHFHYNKDIKISTLASLCNISEVYFRRLFKLYMGISPAEYKQKLRLEKAVEYLKHSTSSISEIAEILGFIDTAYFVKVFSQRFGVTPSKYRKRM